jgi:N-acetylglucosamine kinase-like BadF-type ATPase
VAAALDGRAPVTCLGDHLRRIRRGNEGCDAAWLRELLHAGPSRDEIAALAPAVFEAAEQGCAAANGIVRAAAAELASLIRAVARRLEHPAPLPWSWSGSLIAASGSLRDWIAEYLAADGSSLEMQPPRAGPLEGALALAAEE